ncbi:MAG: hypothetical protein F6J97_09920 [Leptolyngbya sp. SIO4C1]|nr:hypothetical protein [Leptolyngbya sp. SIO4C1]
MLQVAKAASCKLLSYRGQYTAYRIELPSVKKRVAAVKVDDGYFRIFRQVSDAAQALELVIKLAAYRDNLAISFHRQGYCLWIYEPEVKSARSDQSSGPVRLPTYGPANCFIIRSERYYRICYIKVPDLPERLLAIYYGRQFYSLYKSGLDASAVLKTATKFVGRGDAVAIAPTKQGYALCLLEPEAIPYRPKKS